MPDVNLNYVVAKRAMTMIAQQGSVGFLDLIGLSQEDFKKVSGKVPWLPSDRNRVEAILRTLISGVLDASGMKRFRIPAELVAASIAVYVSPVNIPLACAFLEGAKTANDMSRGGNDEFVSCSAEQLYTLIVMFHGSDAHNDARRLFEKNTKLELDKLEEYQEPSKKGK